MRPFSRSEAADELREQAASCRRLALKASTIAGTTALGAAAQQFDCDARSLDPSSLRI